jgi:hypothetical protein
LEILHFSQFINFIGKSQFLEYNKAMKKVAGILLLVIILLGGGVFFFKKEGRKITPSLPFKEKPTPTEEIEAVSFEESRRIAEEAVKNAPTYKFDGFDLQFVSFEALRCPYCWEFTFSFKSRAAGYGDRKGQMLAQVITPHTIRVTVDKGQVTSVVTDQTFDELNQKFLK